MQTFDPDIVLCSYIMSPVESPVPVWVLLYPENEPSVMICTADELSTVKDVGLGDLVHLIDRAQLPPK